MPFKKIVVHFKVLWFFWFLPLDAGNDAVCLPDINKARQKAGLNDLVQAKQGGTTTRLPQAGEEITSDYDNWVWKPVCNGFFQVLYLLFNPLPP